MQDVDMRERSERVYQEIETPSSLNVCFTYKARQTVAQQIAEHCSTVQKLENETGIRRGSLPRRAVAGTKTPWKYVGEANMAVFVRWQGHGFSTI